MKSSDDRVKVLQVVPSLNLGGAEHVAAYLGCAFARPGNLAVCSFFDGAFAGYMRERRVLFDSFHKMPTWKRRMKSAKVIRKCLDLLRGWFSKWDSPLLMNTSFDLTLATNMY